MKKITISIFIFFIVLLLSISIILANNVTTKGNTEINKKKIYYQIKYFDNKIINMSVLLNKDETQIEWKKLLNNINYLYYYWNSAILDLNNLDIDRKNLTDFGKDLDNLTLSIKYQDKKASLINLSRLYEKLIIYIDTLDYKDYRSIISTKYNLLLSSSIIETGNWTLAHEYILKASDNIKKLVNSRETNNYSQYNINQAYVAVKEMENLINIKDEYVFNIKYSAAIQKLESI